MPRKYDMIILGSGVAGLGVALALAKRKQRVLVVEKKETSGSASPAAAGILDPFQDVQNSKSNSLKLAIPAFLNFPKHLRQISVHAARSADYKETGMFYLGFNLAEEQELRRRFLWQKNCKIPCKQVSQDDVLTRLKDLNPDLHGGVFYPSVARVHPVKYLKVLRRAFRIAGGNFLTHERGGNLLIKNRKLLGIQVGSSCLQSAAVVDCRGTWIPPFGKFAIKPIRGQILVLKNQRLKLKNIVHNLSGCYIVPWAPDHYLVGSTSESAGFRSMNTEKGTEQILQHSAVFFPDLKKSRIVQRWAGLRPKSPDSMPMIGRTAIRDLWMAGGYFRSGILLGAYAGEVLAQSIISGTMSKDLTPFDPQRFEQ